MILFREGTFPLHFWEYFILEAYLRSKKRQLLESSGEKDEEFAAHEKFNRRKSQSKVKSPEDNTRKDQGFWKNIT